VFDAGFYGRDQAFLFAMDQELLGHIELVL
jgi:hypothetical protein